MSSVQDQSAHGDLMANRDMLKNEAAVGVWICIIDRCVLGEIFKYCLFKYCCSVWWCEVSDVPPRTILHGGKS